MAGYVNLHAGVGKPLWEITIGEYAVWFKVRCARCPKVAKTGRCRFWAECADSAVGYNRICLALPGNDLRYPDIHPALLPTDIRPNSSSSHQVRHMAAARAASRLLGGLLHPSCLHLQTPVQSMAPVGATAILQRLVLLLHPSGAIQH